MGRKEHEEDSSPKMVRKYSTECDTVTSTLLQFEEMKLNILSTNNHETIHMYIFTCGTEHACPQMTIHVYAHVGALSTVFVFALHLVLPLKLLSLSVLLNVCAYQHGKALLAYEC